MNWLSLVAAASIGAAAPLPPPPLDEFRDRVTNGEPAQPGDAPWQVEVRWTGPLKPGSDLAEYERRHVCGGSFIARNWVLTAGHCIDPVGDLPFVPNAIVRAGSLRIGGAMREFRIVRAMRHAKYFAPPKGDSPPLHDIALFYVEERRAATVAVREPIVPIDPYGSGTAVPPMSPSARVNVTGWGFTQKRDPGSIPDALQIGVLRMVPIATCSITVGGKPVALDAARNLCAKGDDPKRPADSCQGDSGGPLIWRDPDLKPWLVGIVSWGMRACSGGVPGVYVNVRSYLNWIERAKKSAGGAVE